MSTKYNRKYNWRLRNICRILKRLYNDVGIILMQIGCYAFEILRDDKKDLLLESHELWLIMLFVENIWLFRGK